MNLILLIILLTFLSVLTFQDFKYREISWFLIPLLFFFFIIFGLQRIDLEELMIYFGINFMVLSLNLFGVMLIVSLKEKKITNILKNYLGIGDVLFFLVLTVVFSPFNFIFFYLGSILISALIYGCIILFNKKNNLLIPLAGVMSLLLMATIVIERFTSLFQFYQDFILN